MKKLAAIFLLLTVFLLSAGESYTFHLLSDLHPGAPDTYHPTRFKGDIHRAGNGFATLHVSDSGVSLKYHGPGIAAPAVTLPVIKK
jgi:hypothetical protein